jgi:hypothetical protein
MLRSRAALALLFALACASGRIRQREFEPGEHVVRAEGLQLELVTVNYEERHLTLRVAVTNQARQPVTLGREGLLLAYQKLEFPVADVERMRVPASIAVPPGATVRLVLPFETGTPVLDRCALRLRSITRQGQPLDVIALPVPAPIADMAQTIRSPRGQRWRG